MENNKIKTYILYIIFYIILPLLFLKFFAQFICRAQLGDNSYIFRNSRNKKPFMHTPLISREYKFKTLYGWRDNLKANKIQFKTKWSL